VFVEQMQTTHDWISAVVSVSESGSCIKEQFIFDKELVSRYTYFHTGHWNRAVLFSYVQQFAWLIACTLIALV